MEPSRSSRQRTKRRIDACYRSNTNSQSGKLKFNADVILGVHFSAKHPASTTMAVCNARFLAALALIFVKNVQTFSTRSHIIPVRHSYSVFTLHSAPKSIPTRTLRRPLSQRRNVRKKQHPWSYTPLSDGKRKEILLSIVGLKDGLDGENVEANLDVLSQLARLGEGELVESTCDAWMVQSSLDQLTRDQAYRRVLHAWCNQLMRVTPSSPHRNRSRQARRPARVSSNSAEYKDLAIRAEQALEKLSTVEADDYQAVVQAHAQCLQADSALRLLRIWEEPTVAAYASVIRCVLSPDCNVRDYQDDHTIITPVAMAQKLLEECHESDASNSQLSTQVYNRVLDAWSKSLPPFDKREFSKRPKNDEYSDVMNNVEWIWNNLKLPDAKSMVLMIYSYCKSGRVDEAFEMRSNKLLPRLLSNKNSRKERVDSRSFRMLINALSTNNELESAERINDILQSMWKLHELGYYDTAPDVFLYTTAMNSWAQHGKVDHVRELLNDLETRHEELGWKSLVPDTAVYNALVHAIGQSRDASVDVAEEAGSVVKLMERNGIEPDTITYNTLMDACLASSSEKGRERAEQTLLWMVEQFKRGHARVKPTLKSFSGVINAWIEAGHPARAEPLLDVMEERYRPPASLFENIITAWCNQVQVGSSDVDSKRAMRLLLRMQELFEATGNEAIRPNMSLYNQVIRALINSGSPPEDVAMLRHNRDLTYPPVDSTLEPRRLASSSEVFGLLQYLDNVPQLSTRTPPIVQKFNYVISQLGMSGKVWAGQRAEDVLDFMLENKKKFPPDIVTFNSVMAAYARSSHRNAGEKAAEVLEKLKSLDEMGILENDVKADRVSYNTVMNAYSKSSHPMSGSLAETVFHELEDAYEETKDEALRPDIVTYATLLNALATSDEPYSANRAEEILLRMLKDYTADNDGNVKPNTRCFNEVIYAWARSPDDDAAKRAEMVLRIMEDMYSSGNDDVKPDTRTYNVVLYALANSNEEDAPIRAALMLDRMKSYRHTETSEAVKPDAVSYSTAISAWTKQGGDSSINATIMLLEDLYESDIDLDSSFFANLIHSLTRTAAKEAPIAAEIILLDLIKRIQSGVVRVHIDTEVYNALINCWGKSGNKGSAARAVEILQEMQDEYCAGNTYAKPNVQTYTCVIDACAKSRDGDQAKQAEEILNRMEDDGEIHPNSHTYTCCIQAYARSQLESKAKRAQAILQRMKSDFADGNADARPSLVTYNTVLNACEFSVGDESEIEEAFRIACETLDEIRSSSYLTPDDITYGTFLGVIAKLMPKSSTTNELVELVVKRARRDGQLGPFALKKLADATSVSRYRRLTNGMN